MNVLRNAGIGCQERSSTTELLEDPVPHRSRTLSTGLLAFIILLACTAWVAGVQATLWVTLVFAWLALPGLVFALRVTNPGTADLLAQAASGIALTLVSIALIGTGLGFFHLGWILSVPPILAAAISALPQAGMARVAGNQRVGSVTGFAVMTSLFALALAMPAWLNVGAGVGAGVNFRPYFNADLFKHLGIAQSFLQGAFPPVDLFGSGSPVRYYWLQHLIPAIALALAPEATAPVQSLLAVATLQTALFAALLFTWTFRISGSGAISFAVCVIAIASPSMDGLASWIRSDDPWSAMQAVNMEALDLTTAVSAAPYHVSSSTLYRLALYIPQHQLCAIFFLAWAVLLEGDAGNTAAGALRGSLVAAMPATSIMLGVPSIAVVGLTLLAHAWTTRTIRTHVLEWVGLLAAAAIPVLTGMVAPGMTALKHANATPRLLEPLLSERLFVLPLQWTTSLGVLFPFGVAGAWLLARRGTSSGVMRPANVPGIAIVVACAGYVAAEAILPLNPLRIDTELKLSFLLALALVPATALAVRRIPADSRAAVGVVAAALLLPGLPSIAHDVIWHSCQAPRCVADPRQSTTVPDEDWKAMQWIRENTARSALFQQSPQFDFLAGGPDVWIPVFAGRPVFASRRGSGTGRSDLETAARLFDPTRGSPPSQLARSIGVEYLYLSRRLEKGNFDTLAQQYGRDPDLVKVYSNTGVQIWRLREGREQRPWP